MKELYVKLAMDGDSAYILSWQMLDIGDWEYDSSLNVWIGDGEMGDVWLLDQ